MNSLLGPERGEGIASVLEEELARTGFGEDVRTIRLTIAPDGGTFTVHEDRITRGGGKGSSSQTVNGGVPEAYRHLFPGSPPAR